jgi:hypothetical protein
MTDNCHLSRQKLIIAFINLHLNNSMAYANLYHERPRNRRNHPRDERGPPPRPGRGPTASRKRPIAVSIASFFGLPVADGARTQHATYHLLLSLFCLPVGRIAYRCLDITPVLIATLEQGLCVRGSGPGAERSSARPGPPARSRLEEPGRASVREGAGDRVIALPAFIR